LASVLKVDKLDPQSGTALEIGTSGDTVSIPSGATLDISASTLTPPATMPASSGINLTALNATNLGSGTVPTARLGTGTASSSTVLYGDQTYKAEPGGGKVLQITHSTDNTAITQGVNTEYSEISTAITPATTSSKIIVMVTLGLVSGSATLDLGWNIQRDTTVLQAGSGGSGTYSDCTFGASMNMSNGTAVNVGGILVDSPSTTSAVTYKVYLRPNSGSMVVNERGTGAAVRTSSTMTLIEIGA